MKTRHNFLIAFFWIGFIAQLGQVVLIRELAVVCHGSELSFGVTFALWFLWIGSGSLSGGVVVDKEPKKANVFIGPIPVLITAALPLGIWLIRELPWLLALTKGNELSFANLLLLALLALAPFCFLLGFIFALATHQLQDASPLYIIESLGALIAGIAFHFILVDSLTPLTLIGLVSLIFFLCCRLFFRAPLTVASKQPRHWLLIGMVVNLIIFVSGPTVDLATRLRQWRTLAPGQKFLAHRLSRHGYLAVLSLNGQKNFYSNGRYFMAVGDRTPGQLAHLLMVQHPRPRRILLVGGGSNGFLRQSLRYHPERIDYFEMDPALVPLARRYLCEADRQALDSDRVSIHYGDARRHIASCRQVYDLIIAFTAEPATAALNRYYSAEFFAQSRRALSHDGLLIFTMVSAPFPDGKILQRNALILRTLLTVFTNVHLTPGYPTALFLAGSRQSRPALTPGECCRRFRAAGLAADAVFTPKLYATMIEPDLIAQVTRRVGEAAEVLAVTKTSGADLPLELQDSAEPPRWQRPAPDAPINSDHHPRAIFFTLQLNYFLPAAAMTGKIILMAMGVGLAGLIGCWLVALLIGNRRRNSSAGGQCLALALTIMLTGFFGIAIEIVLLWAFISCSGYIYAMIGLFAALFMIGLSSGAYLARSYFPASCRLAALIWALAAISVFAAMMPWLLGMVQTTALLLFLNFLAGIGVGFVFPLAYELYRNVGVSAGRSGGILYGVDMAGASLGALVAGSIAIPLWGMAAVCYALCGMILLAIVVNATSFWRDCGNGPQGAFECRLLKA